jgi:hypothetical protein
MSKELAHTLVASPFARKIVSADMPRMGSCGESDHG